MADGKFLVGKPSGGVTTVTVTDGASNTNLVLPESGNLVSVNTAVTDNAIARYDGTIGKLQNSGVIINDNGDLGVGTYPTAKLSTLTTNNNIAENIFMAGILGVTNGFTVSKDSVANLNYKFLTTNQATGLEIDSSGNVLLKSGTGGLGYGTGAGGSVTQLTSKGTSVTLNKPVGKITTHNATLAAGDSVLFPVYNSLITGNDLVYVLGDGNIINVTAYEIEVVNITSSYFYIKITNRTAGSLSEAIPINFFIIKGAIA